ncbi:MAG: cell division protein FtsZ, partial [Candidatus Puniceispirillaceae bacterium]
MTINLSVPQTMQELRPRITVVGVGGAGGNAVNNMINSDLDGVDFLVTNTDGQALAHSLASRKIQLGSAITQGLGAGSKPDVGRAAAEESIEAVMSELADCNMVF